MVRGHRRDILDFGFKQASALGFLLRIRDPYDAFMIEAATPEYSRRARRVRDVVGTQRLSGE